MSIPEARNREKKPGAVRRRAFYEHTMPELVRETKKLNELLQKLLEAPLKERENDEPAGAGGSLNEEK